MKPIFPFAYLNFILLACTLGCVSVSNISKARAITIARREVKEREWKTLTVVEKCAFENGAWNVVLSEESPTPGGFAIIVIATNGTVLKYFPGM